MKHPSLPRAIGLGAVGAVVGLGLLVSRRRRRS